MSCRLVAYDHLHLPLGGMAIQRMTPEEQEHVHALVARAVSDPDWRIASRALDELTRKLLVVHRLLEAEERLAKHQPGTDPV
jgi:hypothetical protein